jgi:Ca2+-binding RTX toxin-like protein
MALSKVKNYFYDHTVIRLGTSAAETFKTANTMTDIVVAGGGNDRIIASNGDDHIYAQGGNDVLVIAKTVHSDVGFEGGAGRDIVDLSWLDPRKDVVEFERIDNDYMTIHYHGHDWNLMDVEAVKLKTGLMEI